MQIYPPGTMIGHGQYEVVSNPMVGGMGVVYFCLDHSKNRPVALKTFKPEYLPDRAARDRFLREGNVWMQLGIHPHIVRCYTVEYIDPIIFLSLELIDKEQDKEGASLRSWLGTPIPLEQALLFALQIARGMKYAVEKIPGFVHRDLKPENILVGIDKLPGTNINRLLVTDFGLTAISQIEDGMSPNEDNSKALDRTHLTHSILGTPLYMAPEQWQGQSVGVYTDVYALGCILFEMLTGMYAVDGQNLNDLRMAHCNGKLRSLPNSLPSKIKNILACSLSLLPINRYQTWQEVEFALEDVFQETSGQTAPKELDVVQTDHVERMQVGWSYNSMGMSYIHMGKLFAAVDCFEKALTIAVETDDRYHKGTILGNLGIAYHDLGEVQRAITCFEQALEIAREVGSRSGECVVFGSLGNAYLHLGNAMRAIEYYKIQLEVAREINNPNQQAKAIGSIGNAYLDIGNPQRALDYLEQGLAITRAIGDQRWEGSILGNIGRAYSALGDTQRAITYYEEGLAITQEIGDRQGEGNALGNLGVAHADLGDMQRATKYHEQQLVIARENGDKRQIGSALSNLGASYNDLGDMQRAIEYLEEGLVIEQEISNRTGEGWILLNLAAAYGKLEDMERSLIYSERGLNIARDVNDIETVANILFNMAVIYMKNGDIARAISLAQEAEATHSQIGNPKNVQRARQLVSFLVQKSEEMNPIYLALDAFQNARSVQDMQAAVSDYPILKNERFIQTLEDSIKDQALPEEKPAFEKRLTILKQIASQQ